MLLVELDTPVAKLATTVVLRSSDDDVPGPACSPLTDAGTGDPSPCTVVVDR